MSNPLSDAIMAVAMKLMEKADMIEEEGGTDAPALYKLVEELGELSSDAGQKYAELAAGGACTNAQGVALAKRITESTMSLTVFPRPFDLPEGYVLAHIADRNTNHVFACGIDREGRVSS